MLRTLGVEREWFILKNGKVAPVISVLLPMLERHLLGCGLGKKTFGYELFAGQIEDRTKVVSSKEALLDSLHENEEILKEIGSLLGLTFICQDFIEEDDLGKLIVNPFDVRHKVIWKKLTHEIKVAASQVAATHVHVGVNLIEAWKVLNFIDKEKIDFLCSLGDFSQGKRLVSYRKMAGVYGDPPNFKDPEEVLSYINEKGGERDVWDMVRYKPTTGTIEFRCFGATDKDKYFVLFVDNCLKIVEDALK